MCRAIGTVDPAFNLDDQPVDNVLPLMIRQLVPVGFQGLILVGILASVMSTIAAFLNSISTLFTMNVYKAWIDPGASETKLVRVGTLAMFVLMIFSVLYSPMIGYLGGGIFHYFQMLASYVTVPIATVFLIGILWKRATPAASLTVLLAGIPLGLFTANVLVPYGFLPETIKTYSLDNFFINGAITQVLCVLLMVVVSLATRPRKTDEIVPLTFSFSQLRLPADEPKRPFYQSVPFWWTLFVLFYAGLYWYFW